MERGWVRSGQQVRRTKSSSREIFRNRNFVLLWLGQGTSLIGDQFYLIALPWLVLQITGDPVSLGLVLALAGIPRAIFMLAGGALTDRFSPRRVMLASDAARALLTAALAGLVLVGRAEMWMLYGFAIAFGALSGIFTPASTAIVPRLVRREELRAGNAIIQGTAQLSLFMGPALAGGVIAYFAGGGMPTIQGGSSTMGGIAVSFAIDALTFLVSVATLLLMAVKNWPTDGKSDILGSIREGVRYALGDPTLRVLFIVLAAVNFLFAGPYLVGVPIVASSRLPEGAAAFGLLMSAYGGGNLAGIVLSGALPRPKAGWYGYMIMGLIALFGCGIAILGITVSTVLGCAVLAVLGACNGYIGIQLITALQKITPAYLLGRTMSLVMLASLGLAPISQALTGLLINYSLEGLFVGVGVLFVLVAAAAITVPEVRSIGARLQ